MSTFCTCTQFTSCARLTANLDQAATAATARRRCRQQNAYTYIQAEEHREKEDQFIRALNAARV